MQGPDLVYQGVSHLFLLVLLQGLLCNLLHSGINGTLVPACE